MRTALAALGRSGADKRFMGMMQGISAYKESESRMALQEEQRKEAERKRLIEDKKQAEEAEMFDIEASCERLPGGPGGAVCKGFTKYADAMGYSDYSFNPKGQISKGNKAKVWAQLDENKIWARGLFREHYNNLQSQRNEINTQLAEKPDDKKLLEAKEKINNEIHQVGNLLPGISKAIEREHEEKVAGALAAEKEKAARIKAEATEVKRIAKTLQWEAGEAGEKVTRKETERHHRAMEKRTIEDKVPSSGEALKTVASLTKAKATFDKTGEMDLMMAALFPEMAKKKGSISTEEKEQVRTAYNEAIAYYKQFTPKDEKRQKAIVELKKQNKPVTEANIEFIMSHM